MFLRKAFIIMIIVFTLMFGMSSDATASGGKVRGDNGVGSVNQNQVSGCYWDNPCR